MHPWPGCYTLLAGEVLKIHTAVARHAGSGKPAGTVIAVSADGIDVAAGLGALRLLEVQLAGRTRLSAADFLKGRPLSPGIALGPDE
jgi:methionyl-tRNA formyltransferase